MDLATMTMERGEARKAFAEYRGAVRDARHAEMTEADQAIMRGYKALARGNQVISMVETMRAGGFVELGRRGYNTPMRLPNLAVIRADAKRCFTDGIHADGSVRFASAAESVWQSTHTRRRIVLDRGTFEAFEGGGGPRYSAIVPLIPPRLRPPFKLSNYHILFEAEWNWDPPKDPALLRHLGGDLWAVLAIWDLTELERAVLRVSE